MHTEENCRFAKTHEWACAADGVATVGISNHAQEEISDIVLGKELLAEILFANTNMGSNRGTAESHHCSNLFLR